MFFMDCHLAGRMYHDADEVWDELKVGTQLQLVLDTENRYDPKAVAVLYNKPGEDEPYLLGYIPRGRNSEIACFLESGWTNVFSCRFAALHPMHTLKIRCISQSMSTATPKPNKAEKLSAELADGR